MYSVFFETLGHHIVCNTVLNVFPLNNMWDFNVTSKTSFQCTLASIRPPATLSIVLVGILPLPFYCLVVHKQSPRMFSSISEQIAGPSRSSPLTQITYHVQKTTQSPSSFLEVMVHKMQASSYSKSVSYA